MTPFQIILTVILALITLAVGFFFISIRVSDKNADKLVTVGTIRTWQDSKIPFLGSYIIEFTKRGRPYIVASRLMFKPKTLKREGTKNQWTVYTYHVPNKPTRMIAKPYKAKRA